MSFAEALKDENEAVTNNLADYSSQNEGSVRKREAKLSAKKSDLYLQIMREHGYSEDAIEKKLSQTKLAYNIPTLGDQSPATEKCEKQKKNLTVQKPFDLQTAKRMRVQIDEETEEQEYEPLSQQLQKNFQLRVSEKVPDRPRKLTKP